MKKIKVTIKGTSPLMISPLMMNEHNSKDKKELFFPSWVIEKCIKDNIKMCEEDIFMEQEFKKYSTKSYRRFKKMKAIKVTIAGESPLLMNKYNVQAELDRQKGRRISKTYDPTEEAEKSAYWSAGKKKDLIIPSEVLYASILNASSFHKIGKRSAKSILAGSIAVEPMEISLGTSKYTVDTRPVVIQRSRVLKSRARLDTWKASFNITYNEQLIAEPEIVRTVLAEAGQRIGIMDFRPQKGGPYGRFKITEFKVLA